MVVFTVAAWWPALIWLTTAASQVMAARVQGSHMVLCV